MSLGTMAVAATAIAELVERYSANREHYRASSYNEETARNEFITPFFAALGWDVHNRMGAAEPYKDVIHEESIKVGDYTKAPDYTFRMGGSRKFFVEAKKPFVDLRSDPAPAFQLRRYAWSAKLPLSILTDFEELAVYDTRIPPRQGDKASVGRILYYTHEDLVPKLPEIWGVFSKEAVLKGSFDRYAVDTRGKRGTSEVDAEFLKDIESWREELAKNIALRNADLSVPDLNFAVQATIDRIVFLRIAEGRGAEEYGRLQALLNGPGIYPRLVALYRQADSRYNSGLFDLKADRLTPELAVDDKVLKAILAQLYYPQSPYEFSVLPAEILGNVYEQFLGRVIRLTKGHRAVVEAKPEVKKAGGVFYTPADIVGTLVAGTLGRLCEEKAPKQIKALKVVDPACGSGSFLLQAYQLLLDRHLDWYREHQPERHKKEVFLGPGAQWRLTTAEKHAILLSSIYGVDIDRQAVEVTKLSLLLKVLEGETDETLRHFGLFGERALPSLEKNVKCGNSLIGHDALHGLLPDPEEMARINPFDWRREFPEVFKDGGFDAVIGNPPYIRIQTMQEWAPREVELYKTLYRSAASGNYDIYVVFVEKGLSLLGPSGRLGFILPHRFFNAKYGEGLRTILSAGRHVAEVVHFGDQQVFAGASTYTCLLFLEKAPTKSVKVTAVSDLSEWRSSGEGVVGTIPAAEITASAWTFVAGAAGDLLAHLRSFPTTLEAITSRIFQGLKTSADKIYIVEERERSSRGVLVYSRQNEAEYWLEPGLLHPLVKGGDSKSYSLTATSRRILFPYAVDASGSMQLVPEAALRRSFPLTWKYLSDNRDYLEEREEGRMRGTGWYAFGRTQALDVVGLPKLFTPDLAARASFSLDAGGELFFTGGAAGGYGILVADGFDRLYVLALLNSRLLEWFIRQTATRMRGGYFSFEARFIRPLPIRVLDRARAGEKKSHDEVVRLAQEMLTLKAKKLRARTPHEATQLERQVDATEREIDRIVYGLYGVSPQQVKLVEEATPRP